MNVLTGVDKWSVWIGKFSGCESHSSSNDILGKKSRVKSSFFFFFFFDNSDLEKSVISLKTQYENRYTKSY